MTILKYFLFFVLFKNLHVTTCNVGFYKLLVGSAVGCHKFVILITIFSVAVSYYLTYFCFICVSHLMRKYVGKGNWILLSFFIAVDSF